MNKVVVFFVDALGPNLIGPSATPFTYSLSRRANFLVMKSVLGYSGAIHPSIWTSTYPEEHNTWSSIVIAGKAIHVKPSEKILSLMPDLLSRPLSYFLHYSRIFRSRLLPSISSKYSRFFEKIEYDYYHAPKNVNGIPTLFNYVPAMYKFYTRVDDIKPILNRNTELDVYFTGELDHLSHLRLATPKKMSRLLRKIDSKVKELYMFYTKHFPGCHFIAFSDHGQEIIRRRVDVKAAVDSLRLKFGTDYLAAYDSTMARFWVNNVNARRGVLGRLSSIKEGILLGDRERKKYHVDFRHRKFGDIIFLLNPGCEIFPNAYHNYLKNNVQGMHGYLPESSGMKAFFLYSGDAKLLNAKGASVIDIAPTIFRLLKKEIPRTMRGKPLCK